MKKEKTHRQKLDQDDCHYTYKLIIDEDNSLTLPVGLLDQLGITDQAIRDFCLEGKLSGLSKGLDNGVIIDMEKEHRIIFLDLLLQAIEFGITIGLQMLYKAELDAEQNGNNSFYS